MSKSIAISTIQEFEDFVKQIKSGSRQEVEFVEISNTTVIPLDKIQELSTLLPNLKELKHKEATTNIYGSSEKEDEDEDDDEHGACGCCRTDRYE